jgi:hypothetical protein
MTSLADLPGVGPTVAARLARAAGDEAAALAALRDGRLEAFRDVPGVSEARVIGWIRHLRAGPAAERLLATPAARRLHDDILERVASFAATRRGRDRLRLLVPHADPAAAAAHAGRIMSDKVLASALDREAVTRALRRIDAPAPASQRMRASLLVVPADDRTAARLRDAGVHQHAIIADRGDVAGAPDFDVAVLVGDSLRDAEAAVPNSVWVAQDAPVAEIAPDVVLAPLVADRARIAALASLATAVGAPSVAADVLCVLDALPAPGTPASARDVATAVETVRKELDLRLEARVADLRLPAADVLRAASSGRLPTEVRRAVDAVLQEGRRLLAERTGLDCAPFLPTLPITLDDEELARARDAAAGERALAAFAARQDAARRIAPLRKALRDEIERAWSLDATLALGWFAAVHDLHPARFGDGFRFAASVHLGLAADASAQRIAYELGAGTRTALLTGANSGGKTTFLEHLGQLALMARLGLPVVGRDVEVPWTDEVHLVTGTRGMDAGALETFLSTFVPLAAGGGERLVLVDEVEAVTELDAAGHILAFVLRGLARGPGLAVVATHLASEILRHAPELRVDGIEARGLDAQHRLIVDRSPRIGHHARSTPELVVRRLAATAPEHDRALFAALLCELAPVDNGSVAAPVRLLDIAK